VYLIVAAQVTGAGHAQGGALPVARGLVLYDALVHADLLRHCRPDAERVFVGKRAGRPTSARPTSTAG